MALLKIIKAGDPVLKATAKPVAKVNKHIKKILDDMAETMYAADGVGLAAPQVNESLQLIVLDDGNGYYGKVQRASKIKVRSLTRHGKTVIYEPEGFLARIFQHEMDHLYGHLFIEKATDLQKVGE